MDVISLEALKKRLKKASEIQEILRGREFYKLNTILSFWYCMFFFLLGGREAGKSYAVTDCYVNQFVKYGRPFYWLRLTHDSARKLLNNNAAKLVDPDLVRKYKLDLVTNGDCVYHVTKRGKPKPDGSKGKIIEKKLMAKVLDLSTFYSDKGSGLFDNEFLNNPLMYFNICLDEMNREKSEKNSFDIVYNFVNQIENLIRSTKKRVRIICIGNTLDEASDLLSCIGFIPETFGRYVLVKNKSKLIEYLRELNKCTSAYEEAQVNKKYAKIDFGKRAVVEYIEPSEAYKTRRKGTAADILTPTASTFTNEITVDKTLVYKGRLKTPTYLIKFSKDKNKWFTVWNGSVVSRWNGENKTSIAMKPYLDEIFTTDNMNNIISLFDNRGFKYKDLITFKQFQNEIRLIKPRGK